LRLRKDTTPPAEAQPPFPIHFYLVGKSLDGTEVVSYNLDVMLTEFGQQLRLHDVNLTLEAE
jgi:hypothetical protein